MDDDDYAPYDDERSADVAYENFLNEIHPTVKVGELLFDPAEIIRELAPVDYRCGFADWLDSEQRNHNPTE